jgi:hypothetical protein
MGWVMPRFILPLALWFAVIVPGSSLARMDAGDPHVPGAVVCADSPTPGKRPPNLDCAVLLHKTSAIPPSRGTALRRHRGIGKRRACGTGDTRARRLWALLSTRPANKQYCMVNRLEC